MATTGKPDLTSIINAQTGLLANPGTFKAMPSNHALKMDPSNFYSTGSTTSNTPAAPLRLVEELSMPLHKMKDDELRGLVDELENDDWEKREQEISRMAHECAMRWRTSASDPYGRFSSRAFDFTWPAGLMPFEPAGASAAPAATVAYLRFVINLPDWLPPQMVMPFAERQIREQIEEAMQ